MAARDLPGAPAAEALGVVDVGNAPTVEDLSVFTQPRQRATSRRLVLAAYCLLLALLTLRVPQSYARLRENVPPDLAAAIHDENMEALALKTGVLLALVVTALAMAVFFALAVLLEKRLFPARLPLGGRVSVGLYVLVVVLCLVPVQLAGAAFGSMDPRQGALFYVYVGAVGLVTPLLFRGSWKELPGRTVTLLFGTSVGLAALTVIG